MQEHPKSKESFLCWPRPPLWCEEHLWQLQIRTGPGAGTDEAAGGGQAFRKTEMGPGNDTSEGWLAIEMIRCLIETPWSLAWYLLVSKSCSSTYTWSHLQLFLMLNCTPTVFAIPGDQEECFWEAPLPSAQYLHCIKLTLGTVGGSCVAPLVTGGRHLGFRWIDLGRNFFCLPVMRVLPVCLPIRSTEESCHHGSALNTNEVRLQH